ncbi:MAG: flippase-like domain-containing protein, partial [Bacteroidetes bacterium]|nr:flippase-like domain-containing protein [Bacteroidota bacterium]
MKSKRAILFQLFISVLILALLVSQFSFSDLSHIELRTTTGIYLLVFCTLILSLTFRAFRWYLIMNDMVRRVSFFPALKLLFIGQSLNIVLPAGTGDLFKSYYGYKWTGIRERMLTVSLFDKTIAIASAG